MSAVGFNASLGAIRGQEDRYDSGKFGGLYN